jgi:hypothetical protein
LEADLQHHYGVDISDYHTGKLGARRLANFIRRLPRDSETSKEMYGEDADWSRTDHLLAIVADRLAILDWHFVCSKSQEGQAPERPAQIPRPGIAPEPEPEEIQAVSSISEVNAFFS